MDTVPGRSERFDVRVATLSEYTIGIEQGRAFPPKMDASKCVREGMSTS